MKMGTEHWKLNTLAVTNSFTPAGLGITERFLHVFRQSAVEFCQTSQASAGGILCGNACRCDRTHGQPFRYTCTRIVRRAYHRWWIHPYDLRRSETLERQLGCHLTNFQILIYSQKSHIYDKCHRITEFNIPKAKPPEKRISKRYGSFKSTVSGNVWSY